MYLPKVYVSIIICLVIMVSDDKTLLTKCDITVFAILV